MKKRNGFTTIELIAAIIIFAVLLIIIVPSVSNLMKRFRVDYYDKLEKSVNEAGVAFFEDNKIYKPLGLLNSQPVYLRTLIAKNYITDDKVVDYKGKDCAGADNNKSYVLAVYEGADEGYSYHTCLYCPDDDYSTVDEYCSDSWLDQKRTYRLETTDSTSSGNSSPIYIYWGTSQSSIQSKLKATLTISKTIVTTEVNVDGTSVTKNISRGSSSSLNKEKNPDNNSVWEADLISSYLKPKLDDDYSNAYSLKYTFLADPNGYELTEDVTLEKNMIVYKYRAPVVIISSVDEDDQSATVNLKKDSEDKWYSKVSDSPSKYQVSTNGTNWTDISIPGSSNEENNYFKSYTVNKNGNYEDIKDNGVVVGYRCTYYFRIVSKNGNISDVAQVTVEIPKKNDTYTIHFLPEEPNTTNTNTLSNYPTQTCKFDEPCILQPIETVASNQSFKSVYNQKKQRVCTAQQGQTVCMGPYYFSSWKVYKGTLTTVETTKDSYENGNAIVGKAKNSSSRDLYLYVIYSTTEKIGTECSIAYRSNIVSKMPRVGSVNYGDTAIIDSPSNIWNGLPSNKAFISWKIVSVRLPEMVSSSNADSSLKTGNTLLPGASFTCGTDYYSMILEAEWKTLLGACNSGYGNAEMFGVKQSDGTYYNAKSNTLVDGKLNYVPNNNSSNSNAKFTNLSGSYYENRFSHGQWVCNANGMTCRVNYSYDRICINKDKCGDYYLKTAYEINEAEQLSDDCRYATMWCTCSKSQAPSFFGADWEGIKNNFRITSY